MIDRENTSYENFRDKYEKIISNCEFYAIDEKYREAVVHAINKFKESSRLRQIKNPLGYLKVLIYNSINEIDIDMDSKLRYEDLIE